MKPTTHERDSKLTLASSRPDYQDTVSAELTPSEVRRALQQNARDTAVRGTAEDRINFLLNDIFIHTADFSHAITITEQLIERARVVHTPCGLRIVAGGGMGKDALLRFFRRKYPSEIIGHTFICPVIYVDVRQHLKPTRILQHLLQQLRCAYKPYQDVETLENNLRAAMASAGTRIIFFNEAQHLLPVSKSRTRSVARLAGLTGDWFKGFLDRIATPIVLMGVTGWDEIFELDSQLATRIPHRFEFSTLIADAHFVAVLTQLDQAIAMPEPAGLAGIANKKIANGLMLSGRGNWRRLINLLCDAIRFATHRDSPRIELQDFSAAYKLNFGTENDPFVS